MATDNANLATALLPQNANPKPQHISVHIDLESPDKNHLSESSGQLDSDPGNPFGFPELGMPSIPESSTIDPFRNHTPVIEGVYEWAKVVVCLPLVVLRLVLFGVSLFVGYLAAVAAINGWKERERPMDRWRCGVMRVTRVCARGVLFSWGYHWIKRRGRPAPRGFAPIVVSNHIFPTIVASDSHDSVPLVGTIIKAMQVIYVNRSSAASRKHAIDEIKRKASYDRFPRVLLFPEGTTTNGRALLSFQLGAFLPGYPIQPVTVHYPFVHFDQSWGNISLPKLMFRMFTQFHNFMEVEYLPVIRPLRECKLICKNIWRKGNMILLTKAAQMKQVNPSKFMVEMAKVESAYQITNREAVEFLDKFLSMNPDNSSGSVRLPDFSRVLKLKTCGLSKKIFAFLDVEKNGQITFKQFLYGSLYVLKHPSFRRACEVAFSKTSTVRESYISEQEFGDLVRLAILDMSADEVSDLFHLFDHDGDGKVSKDTFPYELTLRSALGKKGVRRTDYHIRELSCFEVPTLLKFKTSIPRLEWYWEGME
ncbi:Lysophospholipid acyltransferase LPEAT2-like protein [Drosera capensis]